MTGRRAIVGLCMLCALVFSAFAAQSASAATKGTTAFTCKEKAVPGGIGFSKAHCKPGDAVASGAKFEHVAIAQDTTTTITGTNEKTNDETTAALPTNLKLTIAGTETELSAATVSSTSGSLINKKEGEAEPNKGEHYAHAEGKLIYSGVTVTKPAGKGCKVFKDEGGKAGTEKEVETRQLTGTTTKEEDNVKIIPASGETFATFFITCTTKVPALEGEWLISGSVTCPTDGATIVCTHAATTAANTLKKGAVKAGIDGKLTLKGRHPGLDPEGSYTPISATTVETP